jgi:hypothetical protein
LEAIIEYDAEVVAGDKPGQYPVVAGLVTQVSGMNMLNLSVYSNTAGNGATDVVSFVPIDTSMSLDFTWMNASNNASYFVLWVMIQGYTFPN